MADVGTVKLKRGLAQMLKGGVIMDVTTAEQAKIAEDAGACAVMALERVPADIRAEGGVARMADPLKIKEIMEAVTIPVMAKARIGHFVEAQVLEALGVDFVDESEVLTPADERYHINKHLFKVPFVCGCRDLGEALRRIGEGAAMIRTKGEAGTGNVVEAVRHMVRDGRDSRAPGDAGRGADDGGQGVGRPLRARPGDAVAGAPARRQLLRGGARHPGGRRDDDAARLRWELRRLRHLQGQGPGQARQGDRRGDHAL